MTGVQTCALPISKIALRTQQVIGYESGITKTVDPMAGSYYMESLCDEIEEQTLSYLKKIDNMGGALRAIEKGFFQSEIRQNAYRLKKEVDSNERILVGVNKFNEESKKKQNLLRIDDSLGKKQERVIKQIGRAHV